MIKRIVIVVVLVCVVLSFFLIQRHRRSVRVSNEQAAQSAPTEQAVGRETSATISDPNDGTNTVKADEERFIPPISRPKERVTKKPFGIKITPENSPISPEQFSGYHTGTDFEIFSGEENADVPVMAICKGTIQEKRTIAGYGGVVIQTCEYRGEIVSVLYGHLRIASVKQKIGDELFPGESFAVLGTGGGVETSGERKHLNLGIIKGTRVDVRGYVQRESELAGWIDPMVLVTP